MDIRWQNIIQIDRPIEQVYAYLANFPRHAEWALTLVRLEQVQPGDKNGLGAQYLTYERQAMHPDRQPFEKLTKGMAAKTMCEVQELIPNQRIAWRAYMVPKTGLRSNLSFELTPATGGGTLLKQAIFFHIPAPLALMFRLRYGGGLDRKMQTQADAGLRNIKTILEQTHARPHPHGPNSA
jgi:uncharacterized membrane protein